MMSYFQDGGHNVCLPLTAAYLLAVRRQHDIIGARCMHYSSCSILRSYLGKGKGNV